MEQKGHKVKSVFGQKGKNSSPGGGHQADLRGVWRGAEAVLGIIAVVGERCAFDKVLLGFFRVELKQPDEAGRIIGLKGAVVEAVIVQTFQARNEGAQGLCLVFGLAVFDGVFNKQAHGLCPFCQ